MFTTPPDPSVETALAHWIPLARNVLRAYDTVCPGTGGPRYNTCSGISRYRPPSTRPISLSVLGVLLFDWLFLDTPNYSSSRPDECEH